MVGFALVTVRKTQGSAELLFQREEMQLNWRMVKEIQCKNNTSNTSDTKF
jgi:hypothetical protein